MHCIHLVRLLLQFHGSAIPVKDFSTGFVYSHVKMEYEIVQNMSFDVTIWVRHCSRNFNFDSLLYYLLYGFNVYKVGSFEKF